MPSEGKKIVRQKLGAKDWSVLGWLGWFLLEKPEKIIKFYLLYTVLEPTGILLTTGPTTQAACPKRRVVKFQVIDATNKYKIV